MSINASIILGDGGSDDFYFVTPTMLDHHVILPRLRKVTIATVYTWPGGVISLWPVPFAEETRIACWKSARAAYEMSRGRDDKGRLRWVQLCWNSDRRDYDVAIAEGIDSEPKWPDDLDLRKLLKLGFADKIIDSPEHAYVLQLRGVAR
jgi:hypothetical protein